MIALAWQHVYAHELSERILWQLLERPMCSSEACTHQHSFFTAAGNRSHHSYSLLAAAGAPPAAPPTTRRCSHPGGCWQAAPAPHPPRCPVWARARAATAAARALRRLARRGRARGGRVCARVVAAAAARAAAVQRRERRQQRARVGERAPERAVRVGALLWHTPKAWLCIVCRSSEAH